MCFGHKMDFFSFIFFFRIESKELDLDSTLETAEENLGTILQANFTMKAIEVERDRR